MRVGVALGSGGARGMAHVGVVDELRARGHQIVAVAGVSIGAVVGGILAAGKLEDFKGYMLSMTRADVLRHLDPAVGAPGLIHGRRVVATLRSLLGEPRIEDCPIPFAAVAADPVNRREVWFKAGSLLLAIRASIAVPALFTPMMIGGRLLVDGGVLCPLPIAVLDEYDADVTVGVSLFGHLTDPVIEPARADSAHEVGQGPAALDPERLSALGWQALPNRFAIGQAALLALDTMQAEISRAQIAARRPDVLIEVPADAAALLDFERSAGLIELGRSLAAEALDAAGL